LVLKRNQEGTAVFNPHSSRIGKSAATETSTQIRKAHLKKTRLKKAGGFVTALAIGSSFMALVPMSAQAAQVTTTTGSYAQGKFLSGSVAGINLDQIIALKSAQAFNSGSSSTSEMKDPLSAAVLQSIKVDAPAGVQLNLGSVIDAGVLSQYARAQSGGNALGASGAVSNDGAVGVGGTGDGTGGNLSINLDNLLNSRFASVISDLRLQVKAVAAQATGSPTAVSGKYSLAGLTLNFTSPALANLGSKVGTSLDGVTSSLNNLGGPNGALTNSVNRALVTLNPILSAAGSSATVNASVTTDLQSSVAPLLTGTYTTPGITLDLKTGSVAVDLDKLLGGLNDKPAGTEVLSDAIVNQILNSITTQIASLADQIKNQVNVSLHNAKVDLDVDVKALSTTSGTPAVPGVPAVPGLAPVLCNVLDILHLCTPQAGTPGTPAIPGIPAILGKTLQSSADVHVHGTVGQILNGTAATATANASLLGGTVNANLNIRGILGGLGTTLTDKLFDNNGAVSQVANSLNTNLLNPAVTALLGPVANGATVQGALTGLLSVKLNMKESTSGGATGSPVTSGALFTETAVRVSVLKDLGSSSLATLNLAQATVGPRVAVVGTPGGPGGTGTPGDPGNPGGTPTAGNPGNPGTTGQVSDSSFTMPTASASGSLAFTGVGIATLIAVLLALVAAGAYLAREGHRRKHLQ
jgi:hypothetical protein